MTVKETQADFGLTAGPPALMEIVSVRGEERDADEFCKYPLAPLAHRPLYLHLRESTGQAIAWPPTPAPAPVPQTALPTDSAARKQYPLFSGPVCYFPDALAAVAYGCYAGNEKHHPGTPLHWDKSKSTDHYDCLMRHLFDHQTGTIYDVIETADGRRFEVLNLALVAWRALAGLQTYIESQRNPQPQEIA